MWLRVFVILGVSLALNGQAAEARPKTCATELIYVTDNPDELQATLNNREKFYRPELRAEWETAQAEFYFTEEGEEVLKIKGLEVMRSFEKPYMASIARAASSTGGKILNVGFGIGVVDSEIELVRTEYGVGEHHIIELNADVAARARAWRETQAERERIFVHQGDWQVVLPLLLAGGGVFDAIAYDGFPLEKQELHRDFVPFLEAVIELRAVKEHTGLITFYMDSVSGFGRRFESFARGLGVGSLSVEKVSVTLPADGNQYWERDFFFTPKLTQITYVK